MTQAQYFTRKKMWEFIGTMWKVSAMHDRIFILAAVLMWLRFEGVVQLLLPTVFYVLYRLFSFGLLDWFVTDVEQMILRCVSVQEPRAFTYMLRTLAVQLNTMLICSYVEGGLDYHPRFFWLFMLLKAFVLQSAIIINNIGLVGFQKLLGLIPLTFRVRLSDGTLFDAPYGPPTRQNREIVYFHTQDLPIPLDNNHDFIVKVFHGTIRVEVNGQTLPDDITAGTSLVIPALAASADIETILRFNGQPVAITVRGVHASPAAAARCGCEQHTSQVAATA